jgi:cytochrome c
MNSFELNKVLGAVLGTCLILLALNIGAEAIFATEKPAKPGYNIVVAKADSGQPEAKEPEVPLPVLLAKAEVDKGERVAKQCATCHNFQKGAGPKIGPDLWNVVGSTRAAHAQFKYSPAMKEKGGQWTFEALDQFIEDPRKDIPGTAMTFAGIKNPQQRADVLAYLRTLADNPVPLPKAEAAAKPAAGDAKPAEAPKAAPAAPQKH